MLDHQEEQGLGASLENPKVSLLFEQTDYVKKLGCKEKPKVPWRFYESAGCQLHVNYPGEDEPGKPIQKAQIWVANFDLEPMEISARSRWPW